MMFRARHLRDDRLFDCHVTEHAGERLDPRTAEHLADCAECRARYTDLSAFMSGLRSEADAEIDAVFSPEALRAQQQHIANRIEHLGQAARVINFPAHQAPSRAGLASHVTSLAPRWIAAAAVAGLVVGVGVGSVFQSGVRFRSLRQSVSRAGAAPVSSVSSVTGVSGSRPEIVVADPITASATAMNANSPSLGDTNDEFLSELELALERPHTRELLALDELTPRVRELPVSNRIR